MTRHAGQVDVSVFAIIISEKGGAERREGFDRSEITIGRVQGNDLMLPKGNVSKRHARLVYRDGRFIVTDLNSTNGTYVNRRRISQATIVREGDRVYIGDFVLRIEGAANDQSGASRPDGVSGVSMPPREPIGTSPDSGSVARAVERTEALTGSYPRVPPAPRLPSTATADRVSSPGSTLQGDRLRAGSRREDSIDTEMTAYRSAVAALVQRVEAALDPDLLDGPLNDAAAADVDRLLGEHLADLRSEGEIAAAVVDDRLTRDARAELLELGPLGALLDDESVTDVAVTGGHPVTVSRADRRSVVEPPFSSERSLKRVLRRLCRAAEIAAADDATLIEGRLPEGFVLTALTGAAAPSGTLLLMRRPHRIDVTLEDLVRTGTISRAIATFLRHCVAARANILVVGPRGSGASAVLGALASASPDGGQVVAVQDRESFCSSSVTVTHLSVPDAGIPVERLVEMATSVPDSRVVVESLSGAVASAILRAVGEGADGVLAGMRAPTIRRGLARLPVEVVTVRPGLTVAAAREWIAGTFDLVLEVARLRDGRQRVVRVAEVLAVTETEIRTQDIFTFIIERTASGGSVEGTFQASGSPPILVDELGARGVTIDVSLFSRAPSR